MKIKVILFVLGILTLVMISEQCTTLSYDARKDKELMNIKDSLSKKVDSLVAETSKGYDDMYGGDQSVQPVIKIDSTKLKQQVAELKRMKDSLAVIMDNIIQNHLENDSTQQANVAKYKAKIEQLENKLANTPPDTIKVPSPIQDTAAKIDSTITSGGTGSWIGYVVLGVLLVLSLVALYFKNKQSTSKKV